MGWESIIGAVLTALISGVIAYFQKKKQDEQNIQNQVTIATQDAMLTSTTQAQTVQAQMNSGAATVPPITDIASAQAAFGVKPTPKFGLTIGQRAMLPQRSIIQHPDRERSMERFKTGTKVASIILFCLILTGCGNSRPQGGVVAQYPVISNPAPPEEMFSNPEIALTDREKAGLNWSAGLYKRVQIYNTFAEQSNANNGYFSTVAPIATATRSIASARRLFE